MRELLGKTIEQSEELQSQQEELRQNNEELEVQTKALKESEANLQNQQEELRVINEELEERTKGLEIQKNDISIKNESLKDAQVQIEEKAKALETASKYKSEFLANMSHELRTPLNSILVLSQILAGKKDTTPLNDKQLEFANTIHSSGEDLLKLINDILDLSKIEAGKIDVNFEEISLLKLSHYAERTFSAVANEKELDFKIEIEDGLPESIVSDLQRVQQIVNNLISNAMKFTSKGCVTMTFHAGKKPGSSNSQEDISSYIGISITDTGIGIPIHKQDIIFEAFKQSDGTTSRKYGGTGLGLSISKELAALLGGFICLESKVGEGSTFTLMLPYEKDKQKQLLRGNEKSLNTPEGLGNTFINIGSTEGEVGKTSGNNEKVNCKINDDRGSIKVNDKSLLIIEDDKNFASILFELAHEKGYKCLIAQEGVDGINLAIKYKPDAILLDIGLPDISGWRVIEKLKQNKDTESISVHVISANDHYNASEKMNSILGYLKKPASLESLELVFMKIQEDALKPLKRILIVDENKDEFGSISENLSKKGFEITILDSGIEAYNLLVSEVFDCLILDLSLKDMSGFELLTKLRNEGITSLQIIIHTENQLTEEDELELQKYTQSIIIKGIRSPDRLLSEVSLFLHDLDMKIDEMSIKTIKSEHEKKDILNNKKILIVDDDMRNIFALTSVLEEKGSDVVVARNGKEGIKKLDENQDIDLILMDIMMPEMDGYAAIGEIRKKERHKKTPIIAITAKAMKDDKQKCIDAGANEYLTKPIDIDKLISLLRVWLYK
jgi:signal transduction histidine kinase/DNA-binding response OmpR family regulator